MGTRYQLRYGPLSVFIVSKQSPISYNKPIQAHSEVAITGISKISIRGSNPRGPAKNMNREITPSTYIVNGLEKDKLYPFYFLLSHLTGFPMFYFDWTKPFETQLEILKKLHPSKVIGISAGAFVGTLTNTKLVSICGWLENVNESNIEFAKRLYDYPTFENAINIPTNPKDKLIKRPDTILTLASREDATVPYSVATVPGVPNTDLSGDHIYAIVRGLLKHSKKIKKF